MRCPWPKQDPLYVAYHDEEWGVPEYDDRALFEKLMLDGFQAGLSWITILRKRDNFRRAFDDFEPEKIARYTPKKVERLMQDAGIVRNRAKIEGAVGSARAYLEIMEKGPGFSAMLWDFVDGKPKDQQFPRHASRCRRRPSSRGRCRRNLSARGFKFVGPTIVYAFMQAVGMVNDHLVTCHRHAAVRKARQAQMSKPPAQRTSSARLAAHAVGPPARSARPLAARRRDRGHRARAGARRALERADQGRAYFLGRAALAAGRGAGARQGAAARCRRRASPCCCTTRRNT